MDVMTVADPMGARTVLVPECHALGMLAAIRSLGRAGYIVHAMSDRSNAIGFLSRFANVKMKAPPYRHPHFAEFLLDYVQKEHVDAIVPGGGLLLTIEPHFEKFSRFLPISDDPKVVYRSLSKADVYSVFAEAPKRLGLLDHHPPSLLIEEHGPEPSAGELMRLGDLLFVKADARYSRNGGGDERFGPLSPADALARVRVLLSGYRSVIVQGAVRGRQAGVSLLMADGGNVLAHNCVIDVHEEPTRNGTMSLRRSWDCPNIVDDAIRRLRALSWKGAAMLEYRVRDRGHEFDFIELNPRFWQYLHLDLLTGVDFPRLQMDWFFGRRFDRVGPARKGCVRDVWPGETSRLLEIWRSPRFDGAQRVAATAGFFLRFLDPRIRSDYGFPGDRWLLVKLFLQRLFGRPTRSEP